MLTATALAIGMHVQSLHIPSHGYQNNTLGAYVRGEEWQAGAYRNSIGRTTVYAAANRRAFGLDWHAGLATGYQVRCKPTSVTYTKHSQTPEGVPYDVIVTEHSQACSGWSRGAIAPMAGVSYLIPTDTRIKPRVFFAPGFKGSSSVIHLSLEGAF